MVGFVVVSFTAVLTQVIFVILVKEGDLDFFEGLLLLLGTIVDHIGLFVYENLPSHEINESRTVDFWVDGGDFAWISSEELSFCPIFHTLGPVVLDEEIYDGDVVDVAAAFRVKHVSFAGVNEFLVLKRSSSASFFVLFIIFNFDFERLESLNFLNSKKNRVINKPPLLQKIVIFFNLFKYIVNVAIFSKIFEL